MIPALVAAYSQLPEATRSFTSASNCRDEAIFSVGVAPAIGRYTTPSMDRCAVDSTTTAIPTPAPTMANRLYGSGASCAS